MVRYIYITKDTNLKPTVNLVSIEDFCRGETGINYNDSEEMFDDMTGNFSDLDIWDTKKDLHGKTTVEIATTIETILNKLKGDGYTARQYTQEDEESRTNPSWVWGHTEPDWNKKGCHAYGRDYFDLPKKDRIEVLMFHLNNLLETCKQYDKSYFAFLSD
jgi:endonuclease I